MWENPACCNSSRSQSGRASSIMAGVRSMPVTVLPLGGQQHGKKAAAGAQVQNPQPALRGQIPVQRGQPLVVLFAGQFRRRWAENAPARRVQYPVMRFCRLASIFVSFPPGGATKAEACAQHLPVRGTDLRPANSVQNARRNGNRRGRLLPHPVFWPDPALRRRGRGPHPLQ